MLPEVQIGRDGLTGSLSGQKTYTKATGPRLQAFTVEIVKRLIELRDAHALSGTVVSNALPALQPLLLQRLIAPDLQSQVLDRLIEIREFVAAGARPRTSTRSLKCTLRFLVGVTDLLVTTQRLPCESGERLDSLPCQLRAELAVTPAIKFGDDARRLALADLRVRTDRFRHSRLLRRYSV